MKNTIRQVLDELGDTQINLGSESARETIASLVSSALKDKGEYSKYTDREIEEQEARKTWVCSICGKNTFDVENDYIGQGTNHLGCDLKIEKEYKPWPGLDMIGQSEEVDGMYTDEEVKEWEEAVGYVEPDNDADVELRDEVFETQKQLYNEMTSDGLPVGGDAQAVKESHKLAEEIVDAKKGDWIYESPDGGETIYKRRFGDTERIIHKEKGDER